MTKPFKLVFVAVAAILLTSCAMIRTAKDQSSPVDLSGVRLGMTKAEAQEAIKKKPDNTIAAEHYDDNTTVEIVQYSQWDWNENDPSRTKRRIDSYWLYFVNDKLDHWHKVRPDEQRPTDLRHYNGR